MKRNPFSIFLLPLLFSLFVSCHSVYQARSLEYSSLRLTAGMPADSAVAVFLQPYHDSLSKTMDKVVGELAFPLDKAMPESSLGNFMADAFLAMAKEKYAMPVDGAIMNYGGVRLTQLAGGPLTVGKIFELMPFDNLLLLQKLTGAQVQQLLDLTASRGGWPIAGMTMEIKDKKAVNIKIGGQPLDNNRTYTIANSDYVANGGDNADFLRNIPQITNGYLMRDALLDYIKKFTAAGMPVTAKVENRVRNAE